MCGLKRDLQSSRRHAFAEGTHKNLKVQWQTFLMFCMYFRFSFLPVTTDTLSLYTQFLSRSFKSTQSIKNYLSGVKTLHYLLGYSTEKINEFVINLGLRGIARLQPHLVKQASAITPDILIKMYTFLNENSAEDSVYWCLFVFAFFLFARKSNLVPTSSGDFVEKKFLLREDVELNDSVLIVTMRWSKTIQFGQRLLKIPLIEIPGSILCPIKAYVKMCKLVPMSCTSPLFSLPHGKAIMYSQFQYKLRFLIEKIGLPPEEFSTHSFRRGGATFAFQSKVSTDLIKAHGDWKSDCYQRYLSFSMEDRLLVAGHMKENIISVM